MLPPHTAHPQAAYKWLRGSDLNRRPLGYESSLGLAGNPLISRRMLELVNCQRLLFDVAPYLSFRGVSGWYGSKTGADDLWVLPNARRQLPDTDVSSGYSGYAAGQHLAGQHVALDLPGRRERELVADLDLLRQLVDGDAVP